MSEVQILSPRYILLTVVADRSGIITVYRCRVVSIILYCIPAVILLSSTLSARPHLGINLYGLSYHLDRRDQEGSSFNEINLGIGAHLSMLEKNRSRYYVEGAILLDSYRRRATYFCVGYQYRIVAGLNCGVLMGLYDSRSVDPDGAVVAAAPLLAYSFGSVVVQVVHLPAFAGINPYPSFASYLTIFIL